MELYNSYNNMLIRAYPAIFRKAGGKITIEDISEAVCDVNSLKNTSNTAQEIKKIIKDNIDEYNSLFAGFENEFPIIFSRHEKEFIRLMLEDEMSCCFLGQEPKDKLMSALEGYDTDYITENYDTRFRCCSHADNADCGAITRTLLDAFRFGKKISYSIEAETRTAMPYRLVYSLRDDRLRLAVRNDGDEKMEHIDISSLKELRLCDEYIDDNFAEECLRFYDSQKRYVEIEIDNDRERNAAERCMLIFNSYKRDTVYDDENDIFIMKIFFYTFDSESIVRDILSMGSAVTVLGTYKKSGDGKYIPDDELDIRQQLIDTVKKAYKKML